MNLSATVNPSLQLIDTVPTVSTDSVGSGTSSGHGLFRELPQRDCIDFIFSRPLSNHHSSKNIVELLAESLLAFGACILSKAIVVMVAHLMAQWCSVILDS